jgi:hypothetical protein
MSRRSSAWARRTPSSAATSSPSSAQRIDHMTTPRHRLGGVVEYRRRRSPRESAFAATLLGCRPTRFLRCGGGLCLGLRRSLRRRRLGGGAGCRLGASRRCRRLAGRRLGGGFCCARRRLRLRRGFCWAGRLRRDRSAAWLGAARCRLRGGRLGASRGGLFRRRGPPNWLLGGRFGGARGCPGRDALPWFRPGGASLSWIGLSWIGLGWTGLS